MFRKVTSSFLHFLHTTDVLILLKQVRTFRFKRDLNKDLRITCSNKVCSEQDGDVKFVDSQIRKLKDGACHCHHFFYGQQEVI